MEAMPPQKERRRSEFIPTELVEKILLNLPVKSLTRFSSVSKSWKSTIHSRDFAKRYRGREMIVLKPYSDSDVALVSPLSSMPLGNSMANFPRPTMGSYFNASCGDLWCVEFEGSVCLYNPSTRTHRKLPAPPSIGSSCIGSSLSVFIYGLGHDSATDDYKVLKFRRDFIGGSELYSRRIDSWRKISDSGEKIKACMALPPWPSSCMVDFLSAKGVFVCGSLHWIVRCGRRPDVMSRTWVVSFAILSFDLSMEEFGKVALPESVRPTRMNMVDVSVLRGKLCVYSNHRQQARAAVWVYDYGGGLWRNEMMINYSHVYPLCYSYLKPLYFYENIKAFITSTDIRKILILCKDESTLEEMSFGCGILDSFTYVESMLKP